jgi:diguanylate cyclase (GGDEF)-like protein
MLTVAAWGLAQRLTGAEHWSWGTWIFNLLSQGVALLAIGGLVAELTARLEAERVTSRTDALTGLRNRRALLDDGAIALALSQRHARPVSLAFVDLDGFKQVNDRRGHARGNVVLQACAAMLVRNSRAADLVARLGGDEFVVLMPETASSEACNLMDRLRASFATMPRVAGTGVDMTIGVLTQSSGAGPFADLLGHADELMYQARRAGKGRCSRASSTPKPHEPASLLDGPSSPASGTPRRTQGI